PPLAGSREFADTFGELPEPAPPSIEEFPVDPGSPAPPPVPEPPPAAAADDEPSDITPAITAAPAPARRPYRLPPASILTRGRAVAGAAQDHERVARQLLEALASFGVEARLVGMVN